MLVSTIVYEYMGYKDLSNVELVVIEDYFNNSKRAESIDKLFKGDTPLSKDMRRFIADIFTRRLTLKKMGRQSNTRRDKFIHWCVEEKVFSGMNLTSNRFEGAVATVAERMELSEDVVLKAYQKIENGDPRLEKGEGYNDPRYLVRMTAYDDKGVVIRDCWGDIY